MINGNLLDKIISNIFIFSLLFLPILNYYDTTIPSISWGELLIIIVSFIIIIIKKPAIYISKCLLIFIVYMLSTSIISLSMQSEIANYEVVLNFCSFAMYYGLLIICINLLNYNRAKKMYVLIGVLLSSYLIIQYLVFTTTNQILPGLILNVKILNGINSTELISKMNRVSSLFTEPAHFAQYIAIPLMILLFDAQKIINNKYRVIGIVILSMALILSSSGNALVIMAIVIFIWLIFYIKDNIHFKKYYRIIAIFILGIFVIILMLNSSKFISLLSRVSELSGNNPGSKSGYLRIVRGYEVYMQFDNYAKIFGVGLGNYVKYSLLNDITALTAKADILLSYLNGIQHYLIHGGIVGLTLYMYMLIDKLRITKFSICLFLTFIMLSFIGALVGDPMWLIYTVFIFKEHQHSKKSEIRLI